MKHYFILLAVLIFFTLQFVFVLPYTMSSADWIEFTFGWIIVLVIDPIVCHYLFKRVGKEIDDKIKEVL